MAFFCEIASLSDCRVPLGIAFWKRPYLAWEPADQRLRDELWKALWQWPAEAIAHRACLHECGASVREQLAGLCAGGLSLFFVTLGALDHLLFGHAFLLEFHRDAAQITGGVSASVRMRRVLSQRNGLFPVIRREVVCTLREIARLRAAKKCQRLYRCSRTVFLGIESTSTMTTPESDDWS